MLRSRHTSAEAFLSFFQFLEQAEVPWYFGTHDRDLEAEDLQTCEGGMSPAIESSIAHSVSNGQSESDIVELLLSSRQCAARDVARIMICHVEL